MIALLKMAFEAGRENGEQIYLNSDYATSKDMEVPILCFDEWLKTIKNETTTNQKTP